VAERPAAAGSEPSGGTHPAAGAFPAGGAGRPDGEDAIEISGIRAYGYTGYFPEEQTLGQWFEADLRIWLDLTPTGASDDLAVGLDYAEVVRRVTELLETSRFRTIERLNTAILEALLALAPVRRVHSRLVKVAAPIPGFDGRIAVSMTRSRPGSS
jgi:dihydroneopterin aldolase